MKNNIIKLSFLLITVLISSSFIVNDWVLFQQDNYQILFPGKPTTDSTTTQTKIGDIHVYTHMYESPENTTDSNLVYGLSVSDYPPQYVLSTDKAFLDGFFGGIVKGIVESTKGKLISEKDIVIKNYRGKEIKIDYGNGTAVITTKVILVNARVYGLQTISFPGKEINNNASRFYNSFDIK